MGKRNAVLDGVQSISILAVLLATLLAVPSLGAENTPGKEIPGSCGQMSLTLCMRLLGKDVSCETILRKAPARREGISLAAIRDLALEEGLDVAAVSCDSQTLVDMAAPARPAIFKCRGEDHFMVTTGALVDGSGIVVFDASKLTKRVVSLREFHTMCEGTALLLSASNGSAGLALGWLALLGGLILLTAILRIALGRRFGRGQSMKYLQSLVPLALAVCLCADRVAPAMGQTLAGSTASTLDTMDSEADRNVQRLFTEQKYEEAVRYLRGQLNLSDGRDVSRIHMRLAQVEYRRGRGKEAFAAFSRALQLLSSRTSDEVSLVAVEEDLRAVRLIRMRGGEGAATRLLEGLRRLHPSYSSIGYELAYLAFNRNDVPAFFCSFYDAFARNPRNPLCLPGRLIVERASGAGQADVVRAAVELVGRLCELYDDTRPWAGVVAFLNEAGALDDEKAVDAIAGPLPERERCILLFFVAIMKGTDDAAAQQLETLKRHEEGDPKLQMLRRRLMLELTGRADGIEVIPVPAPQSPQGIVYRDLALAYHLADKHLSHEGLDAARRFVDGVGDWASGPMGSADEGSALAGIVSTQIALARVEVGDSAAGIAILNHFAHNLCGPENHPGPLDGSSSLPSVLARNCRLLGGLLLQRDEIAQALDVWKEEAACETGADRRDTTERISDYERLLADCPPQGSGKPSALCAASTESSISAPEGHPDGGASSRVVFGVPASYNADRRKAWQLPLYGSCVPESVRAIVGFYGVEPSIEDVCLRLDAEFQQGKDSVPAVRAVLSGYGLQTWTFAPICSEVKSLLDKDLPLMLFRDIISNGSTTGHVSVVFGYSNAVAKVFLKEFSDAGESRVRYADMVDCEAVVLAVPPGKYDLDSNAAVLLFEWAAAAAVPSHAESPPEQAADATFWQAKSAALRLRRSGDSTAALKRIEEALALRCPSNSRFYEDMVRISFEARNLQRASEAAAAGLSKHPDSLNLLRASFVLARDAAFEAAAAEKGSTDISPLWAILRRMEEVNPDYPDIYFLRGDLYARKERWDEALSCFRTYLQKGTSASDRWRRANEASLAHARRTVQMLTASFSKAK